MWPGSLQSLSFEYSFDQSLENVALPGSLQFGGHFNQSLENVALPGSLQSLSFGESFNQSLENVALPDSLQSLSFEASFNQSLENVAFPSGLAFFDGFGFICCCARAWSEVWQRTLKSKPIRMLPFQRSSKLAKGISILVIVPRYPTTHTLENPYYPSYIPDTL